LPPIVAPNLLKASTNSLVISVLWQSVAEKLRLGLRIDAIRSQSARNGSQSGDRDGTFAWTADRADRGAAPLGASNQGPNRDPVRGAPRIVFGMPLWPRAAHVVQLRPVRVEQGLGQTVQEIGDVGAKGRSLTASIRTGVLIAIMTPVRSARCFRCSIRSLVSARNVRVQSTAARLR
jgi:hypothetical protein